jgi:hypothetical protein
MKQHRREQVTDSAAAHISFSATTATPKIVLSDPEITRPSGSVSGAKEQKFGSRSQNSPSEGVVRGYSARVVGDDQTPP